MVDLTPLPSSDYVPNVSEGIFLLDWKTYLADTGINQSALKFIRRSMAHWEAEKARKKESTPDQIMGSLLHLSVLEPEFFGENKSHYVTPQTYFEKGMRCPVCQSVTKAKKCAACKVDRVEESIEKAWSGNADECKEWVRTHKDLPIVNEVALARVKGMCDSIMKDETARDFIDSSHTEVAIFCNDAVTGIRRKCRMDLLGESATHIFIGDFKKMPDVQEEAAARTFAKWGYYIQADYSKKILRDLMEKVGLPQKPIRFINGCVEHLPPFDILWWELNEKSLELGRKHWLQGLHNFANSTKTGKISGYDKSAGIRTLTLAPWMLRELDTE